MVHLTTIRLGCRMRSSGPQTCLRTLTTSSALSPRWIPRPYQESCLQACLQALDSGLSRVGVSLPTGSGKTAVFVSLISRLPSPRNHPKATQALIIVNGIELALQAARQVEVLCPQLSVEIEQGAKHIASGRSDVTVATYQTLLRPDRIAKFDPSTLKLIVVDEAHHAAAPSYRRILARFEPDIRSPDVDFEPPTISHRIPIVGFSATFSRHDGLALGAVFQRIVYHRDFLEMIREQWLCNVRFTSVKAKLNLSEVTISKRTGDFNPTSLAQVINTNVINELVVRSWLEKAFSRRSTLVFCVSLAHLRSLTDSFRRAGIDARYVYSGTPAAERRFILDSFKNGDFPVLLNVAILTEGADIPNIDCVIIARPTRSRNVFAQMIGRGMRLSPLTRKEDCHIIDFVESSSRVSGVVCTPTLFGLDPDEVIHEDTLDDLKVRAESMLSNEQDVHVPDPTSITYVDYDNPFALIRETSGAPHISRLSGHAWVGCGGDVYVLECMGKGYIRISPTLDGDEEKYFEAHYVPAGSTAEGAQVKKVPRYLRKRKILTAETLDDAVRGGDTYAKSKILFGNLALSLFRTAGWRRRPATQGQKDFLRKCIGPKRVATLTEGSDTTEAKTLPDIERMTKGDAANIITRLKHGAQARYSTKVRAEAKKAVILEREKRRQVREEVHVGDLSAVPSDI